jgi:hypothetical protein
MSLVSVSVCFTDSVLCVAAVGVLLRLLLAVFCTAATFVLTILHVDWVKESRSARERVQEEKDTMLRMDARRAAKEGGAGLSALEVIEERAHEEEETQELQTGRPSKAALGRWQEEEKRPETEMAQAEQQCRWRRRRRGRTRRAERALEEASGPTTRPDAVTSSVAVNLAMPARQIQ